MQTIWLTLPDVLGRVVSEMGDHDLTSDMTRE